ncbi:MAG: hypothetical protein JWM81_1099 [Candidatus Saccharibacteria bacterium]|nr:hypothetical protein [Candidatus Saccharibacteria bacterium]
MYGYTNTLLMTDTGIRQLWLCQSIITVMPPAIFALFIIALLAVVAAIIWIINDSKKPR